MGVKIDKEFRDLIPPPSAEEKRILESKLKAEGCQEKLVAWGNDPDNVGGVTLIEGHTRQAICERLGIGYAVRELKFPGRDAVMEWIEDNQLGRRNLTDDQRAALAFRRAERLKKVSQQERAATANAAKNENSLVVKMTTKEKPAERIRETVAKEAKVSERKVRSVKAVADKAPELVKKIADGEVTISQAKKQVADKPAPAKQDPPDEPWASFNETVGGFISELRSVALRLGKALEHDTKTKRFANRFAHFYTHAGTVGAINAVARTLADNRPAAVSDKPPGYLPLRVVEARESVAAER